MPKATLRLAVLGFALTVGGTPLPGLAQSVQLLGDFSNWSAYTTSSSADRLCFIMSKPVAVTPQIEGLTQPYFYVSHRPGEAIRYEVNLVAGFAFAPDTPATAQIGGQLFQMFTEADAAWLENVAQSADIASAIRAGSQMVVEATSERGIRVTQTFSLSGATASMRAIDAACG
ncbi:MAG: invasion associated locus B family protein [Cucumibacter sp.]